MLSSSASLLDFREIIGARGSLGPPSQALMIGQHANEIHRKKVARPKRFELLTPKFVVLCHRLSQPKNQNTSWCKYAGLSLLCEPSLGTVNDTG